MLISHRLSVIGLQLLVATHIAHTFVLLTANVDDVKKLARKFVSESLAEKIAEFIATATKNMAANLSGENDMSIEGSHQVSEENNRYNIERHGFESAAQENAKSQKDLLEKGEEVSLPDTSISKEQKEIPIEKSELDIKRHKAQLSKPEYAVRLEGPSRYIKVTPTSVKQYAYHLERDKKPNPNISEEDEKYNRENVLKILEEDVQSSTPPSSSSIYAEKHATDNKPARKKVKGRPYRLLSHLNSIENNEVTDFDKILDISNSTLDDFSENELFVQRRSTEQLTTKKAAFEFDQYDTRKYSPNSDLIATSGSVVLRRVPEDQIAIEKWWEKGLPDENGKRKS